MRPSLKYETIPQIDSWGIIITLFASQFIFYFIFRIAREGFLPSLPLDFLDIIVKALTYTLILSFCIFGYGNLSFREFIPNRQDFIYLIITITIIFWIFGLFIGPERLKNPGHEIYKGFSFPYYMLSLLFVIVVAPFVEEAIFRRYFLEIQRQHYSTIISILITSIIAAIFHLDSPQNFNILPGMFFKEAIFGILYVKTRLGISVLAHMFNNVLVILLSL